jgi:hypothetical protein
VPVIYLKLLRDFRPIDPDASTGSALLDSPILNIALNVVLPRKEHTGEQDGIMDFFQGGFREEIFFWEVIECFRKLALTGFAVFFGPGSMVQLGMAIMLTMAYMVTLASFSPYKTDEGCNSLARIEQAALFLVLLEMAMVKYVVTAEAIPNPAFEAGVDLDFLSVALVVTQLSIGIVGLLAIAKEIAGIHGPGSMSAASAPPGTKSKTANTGAGTTEEGSHTTAPPRHTSTNPMMEAEGWAEPQHKTV